MFLELVFQVIMSFFACIAFSIIFNAPRKELPFCGICGKWLCAAQGIWSQQPPNEAGGTLSVTGIHGSRAYPSQ